MTISKNEMMRRLVWALGLAVGMLIVGSTHATPIPVFINEFHYDNEGTDSGEAIEVAGPAGTNLAGWQLVLYNGANGLVYSTTTLGGMIANQQNGFGTLSFTYPVNGIQNGSPDGIALVDNSNNIVQFLSYEGFFTAQDGLASGMTSVDIGVSESGFTKTGYSLQLMGSGSKYEDFTWASAAQNTFGAINTSQTLMSSVPEPATLALLGLGLVALRLRGRKRS